MGDRGEVEEILDEIEWVKSHLKEARQEELKAANRVASLSKTLTQLQAQAFKEAFGND